MKKAVLALIEGLTRCAEQNEADARTSQWITHSMDAAQAREQRRVIAKLKSITAL